MNEIKKFVEENPRLVTRKESKRYPGLFVLKYAKRVFYDNLWHTSPLLLDLRGLVVDSEYNLIARPFTKIFNYGENGTGGNWSDASSVTVTRKVNGFMATVTRYKDQVIISTTGSLDSDFVGYAEKYLLGITASMIRPHVSYMFEIVHPDDPHIIPEAEGAHLLAAVEHDNGNHHYSFTQSILMEDAQVNFEPLGIHIESPKDGYTFTFGDIKKIVKSCKHEGFVIVNLKNNETIKIKSPYYLFNKFLARVGTEKLISGFKQGTIKQRIDEEYYPIIDRLKEYGIDKFTEQTEQQRLITLKQWIEEL